MLSRLMFYTWAGGVLGEARSVKDQVKPGSVRAPRVHGGVEAWTIYS